MNRVTWESCALPRGGALVARTQERAAPRCQCVVRLDFLVIRVSLR